MMRKIIAFQLFDRIPIGLNYQLREVRMPLYSNLMIYSALSIFPPALSHYLSNLEDSSLHLLDVG